MPGWLLCYLGEFPFCQSKEKWGQRTCFKGQTSLLSHICTPTLHLLVMDSYNVKLGWKTIVVSHWVRVTIISGPGSWRMMEDMSQEPGRKMVRNGFPESYCLIQAFPQQCPWEGDPGEQSPNLMASQVSLSPSPQTHRTPMPQKHSMF